ncbi:hypothetical protein E2C01_042452 [Portunus trituberculatus]|uniref:Uncharacterized protein n=1 Tax=Portunus trituberculatus TaxID=210409 RepID=A0A5B7FMG5_PORTR|nr:hypothetical protein [Portunus trituberculatus]
MITWGASRPRQPDLSAHESAPVVQGTASATHRRTAHAAATTLSRRLGVAGRDSPKKLVAAPGELRDPLAHWLGASLLTVAASVVVVVRMGRSGGDTGQAHVTRRENGTGQVVKGWV